MADVYDDYLSKQLEIEKALGSTSTAIYLMSEKYAVLAKSVREATTLNSVMEKGLTATVKAHIEGKKNLQDHITALISLTKEQNAYVASQKKMQETVERGAKGLKGYIDDLEKLGSGAQNLIGKMGALAGTFGVASMSLSSLSKAGIEFDRNLLQLSRSQQVAGKGAQDLGAALAYVQKNTVLAKTQFVELAKAMQDGFLGVKPSLMEIAEITKMIGAQVGSSFETQKDAAQKLIAIQSQFPAIGEKIIATMKEIQTLSDKPSEGDQKRIANARQMIVLRLQESGATQDTLKTAMELTTALDSEQKKLNQSLTEQAQLNKAYRDAEIEFYNQLRPLMMDVMKGITSIIKVGTEWKNTIIGATAALTGLRAIQVAFNIAASMNPYVKLASVIATVAVGIAAMFDWQKKSNDEADKMVKLAALDVKRHEDIKNLQGEQLKAYNEQWQKLVETNASVKDLALGHDRILSGLKQEDKSVEKMRLDYGKVMKDVEQEVALLDKVSGSLKTQSSIMEEFGGYSEAALKNLIQMAEITKEQAARGLASAMESIKKSFEGTPIKLNIDTKSDIGTQSKQMMEFIQGRIKELNASIAAEQVDEKRNKLLQERNDLSSKAAGFSAAQKAYMEKEADITRATISDVEKNVRLQEKFTSAYESRLDTERKLMESAQFGLGASVEMMKKQVELAYQLMKTYADTDKLFEQEVVAKTHATDADMKAIKNAKTQLEAQNYVYNVMKKQGDEAQLLLNYAVKHQEYSKKEMDQQQKIYELTKDIREGYLDAMREMATGFGEFSKIIGTQEMGVTQLMSNVKEVTGKNTLNTFKLGGMQSAESVAAGVGTDYSGMYTTSGMAFESGSATERKNLRITGYGESVEDARKSMEGDMSGRKATAGGATVQGVENYTRAGQIVASVTGEKVEDGMVKGWERISKSDRDFSRNILAINPAVTSATGQVPNDASKIQANARTVGNQYAGYLGGSPSPSPAGNVFVPNVPGNRLAIPSETDATLSKLLAVNIKISEQDFKALKTARNMEDGQKILADLMRKQNATVELQGDEFKKLGISQNSEYKKIVGEPNEMAGPLSSIASMQRRGAHTDYRGSEGGKKAASTTQSPQTSQTPYYVRSTQAEAAAAPIAPAVPSAPPAALPSASAGAGASGDIWDKAAALENKGIEKTKEGALSPVAGVAAVGLGGKLVKSGATRALLLKNAKMELEAAKFAASEAAKLGPGAGTVLRDATYQAAEKAELSRQFAANSKNLNRLSTAGRMGSRIAGATSLAAGAGGSALGGDIADLAQMGNKGKLGLEIGGGVAASLAASAMPSMASLATGFAGVTAGAATAAITAAGAVGYGAGKALDWGSGKITGKSMSTHTGDFLTRNAWLGGGGELGGYDPAAVDRMKRIKQNKEIREAAEAKKIAEAQKTKATVVAEVKKQESKAVEETKKPVAAIAPPVKPPSETESIMARAAQGYQETRDKEAKEQLAKEEKERQIYQESQKGVFGTDAEGYRIKLNKPVESGVYTRDAQGKKVKMESATRPAATGPTRPQITKPPITTIEDRGYIGGKKVLDKEALARQKAYEKAEELSKKSYADDAFIKKETGIGDFSQIQQGIKMRTDALGTSQLKEGRFKGPKATEKMVKEALFAEGGSYAQKLKDLTKPKEVAKPTAKAVSPVTPSKAPDLSGLLTTQGPWTPSWAKPLEVPGLSAEAPLYGPRIDPVKAKAEADAAAATSKIYSQSKAPMATFRSRLKPGAMDKAQMDKELAVAKEADKTAKEAKKAAKEASKTVEDTGKKAGEHEAKRGVTGGIIPDTAGAATHKVSEIDAMADRGRERVSTGREGLHSEKGLGRTGQRIRGIGESGSRVRGLGQSSRQVRGIGESGHDVKSSFAEGGGDTYHENLKRQAEKQEKEAKKVQKSTAPAQEAKKGADKVATVEKARGQSKEETEGNKAGAAMQQAYVASAGQREAMFGTQAEGGGSGGGGGTINVVIHLDKGLIASVDKKVEAVKIVTDGVHQGASSVGKGST